MGAVGSLNFIEFVESLIAFVNRWLGSVDRGCVGAFLLRLFLNHSELNPCLTAYHGTYM
jgi:hypothetical protein